MNLIYFTFLMRIEGVSEKDPEYVLEKWNRYIGINPLRADHGDGGVYFTASQELGDYYRKWGVENDDLKSVLMYIFSVNMSPMSIVDMIRMYKLYIGTSGEINNEINTSGIHEVSLRFINKWMESEPNEIHLGALKRDMYIDDILS